jgi:hypothetical protein
MRALIAGCTVGLGVSWNIANTGAVAETLARHYAVGLGAVGLLTSIVFFAEIAVMIPGGRAIRPLGRARRRSGRARDVPGRQRARGPRSRASPSRSRRAS